MLQFLNPFRRREVPRISEPSPLRDGPHGTFVYIHINKCGGTSIGRAIGLPRKQHLTARDVICTIGREAWNDAYRFSIIRNPWDKVVSHYKHRLKTGQTGLGDRPLSFADWLQRTYGPDKDPLLYDNPTMFLSQCDWLRNDQGHLDVPHIGRFENLAEDFQRIAAEIGLPVAALPHLNQSPVRSDYRSYYDVQTADVVRRHFAEDIERFGYTID